MYKTLILFKKKTVFKRIVWTNPIKLYLYFKKQLKMKLLDEDGKINSWKVIESCVELK